MGGAPSRSRADFSTSIPSIWGILMSRKTTSASSRSIILSPAGPLAARMHS
jgi:hypothetical protein